MLTTNKDSFIHCIFWVAFNYWWICKSSMWLKIEHRDSRVGCSFQCPLPPPLPHGIRKPQSGERDACFGDSPWSWSHNRTVMWRSRVWLHVNLVPAPRERMRSVYVFKSWITLKILTDSEEKIKIHREFSALSGALWHGLNLADFWILFL